MKNIKLKHVFLGATSVLSAQCFATQAEDSKPNVLFIMMDDMCDWHNYLGGNKQVITPNLDRLAARGVFFSNAYCGAPLSNPSRCSLLTGIPPYISGIYENTGSGNEWQDSPQVNSALSMPEQFKNNGYKTILSGKIYHTKPTNAKLNQNWDDRTNMDGGYGPWPSTTTYPNSGKWQNIEEWTGPDTDFPDVVNSKKIIDFLGQSHDKPFFAAMGFYRPHTPYSAPKRYFDMYDADTLQVPANIPDDLDDIPTYAYNNFIKGGISFHNMLSAGDQSLWKERVKAYMACVTFADDRIGMILDALDASPYADNTIIVMIGDNGFHLGQKKRWGKSALWREASHVPMLVVGTKNGAIPSGKRCDAVVSLLDVYPTLNEICDFPAITPQTVYGKSLQTLLENPSMEWDVPVVTAYLPGNFAIHSNDWSYIRYTNGTEELYSTTDEDEFYNLAGDSQYDSVKEYMQQFIYQQEETIIYVKPNGTGDGTSWNAAAGLSQGIEIANRSENQTSHQLWLAGGTYNVASTIAFDYLQLYGGFSGNETELDQRNWQGNPTILDGGSSVTVLRTQGTGKALADGLIIQNGYSASDNGGGVFMKGGSTLRNCIIRNNSTEGSTTHGGGVNMAAGNNYLENCLVVNNTSSGSGGGVQLGGGSSNLIINTTIVQNVASDTNKSSGIGLAQPVSSGATTLLTLYNSILYNNRTATGDVYESIAQNNGNVNFPANESQNKFIEVDASNSAIETTSTKITFNELNANMRLDRSYATSLFVEPAPIYGQVSISNTADYNSISEADYRLKEDSPCIDAGDITYVTFILDLAGKDRIQGTSVDMGAYEYASTNSIGFTAKKNYSKLNAFRQGNQILVTGAEKGDFIRIYNASGQLIDKKKAESGIIDFILDKEGLKLIVSKNGHVKIY